MTRNAAGGRSARVVPPSLEEALLGSWHGPFGWMVIAQPVAGGQLREMAREVALAQLAAQRPDSPRAQLAARRAAGRHAELQRARAAGLWEVRLVAGGESLHAAGQLAALLCASADLEGLPYALVPTDCYGPLAEAIGGPIQRDRPAAPARDGDGWRDAARQPAAAAAPSYGAPAPAPADAGSRTAADDDDPVPRFPCAGSSRLSCPAFLGQESGGYFMLLPGHSGTRPGPPAESCTQVPSADVTRK